MTIVEPIEETTMSHSNLSTALETAIRESLDYLRGSLQCSLLNCESHDTVAVVGLENECAREAIARYLVGTRASAIDAALNIRADLEDTQEDRDEIYDSVIQIVRQEIDASQESRPDWVTNERNPWIAEGVWHLMMALAATCRDFHPPGLILLVNYAHIKAKDHGMDVSAIYADEDSLGLTIIETKAYKNAPNNAISDATTFFREVKNGTHDARVRQAVQIMRTALPENAQGQVSGTFWKRNRVYVCNPHYSQSDTDIDWTVRRPSLKALASTCEQIFVMPNALASFDQFFNDIADRMRRFAGELRRCTMTTPAI